MAAPLPGYPDRVKGALAATLAVAVGLFVANMLGVAVAEAPTVTPTRTISVQGVASVPIGQADDAATATGVYREAMSAAVTDGQGKASFLAGKVGATITQIQSVVEDGGYIQCTAPGEGYAQYEGEEPDFGSAPRPVVAAPVAASAPAAGAPGVRTTTPKAKPKRKHKRPKAKRAVAGSCKLTAQVSLVYAIG